MLDVVAAPTVAETDVVVEEEAVVVAELSNQMELPREKANNHVTTM